MTLLLTAAALAGVALIAAATLAGAWLGWRSLRLPRLSLACAALLLLVVVIADLLPDAWNDLSSTGLPWWPAAGTLGAGFLATDALVRQGCACGTGQAGGRATTAVLGLHRAVEGAALAVAGSVAVIHRAGTARGQRGFRPRRTAQGRATGKGGGTAGHHLPEPGRRRSSAEPGAAAGRGGAGPDLFVGRGSAQDRTGRLAAAASQAAPRTKPAASHS